VTGFIVGEQARLLVVAAHADDEVLGAGGTLARARGAGVDIHIVVCSHSVQSRSLDSDAANGTRLHRQAAAHAAATRLGAASTLLDLPDNDFESLPLIDLIRSLEGVISEFRPTVVLTHSAFDLSRDHDLVNRAVVTATRPQPGAPASVLAFEVRSATDWAMGMPQQFAPSVWVALDAEAWQTKLDLLDIYADELRPWPHARSREGIDALARYRGSQVGVDRAEAFALLRSVVS
jgi:LmbE family N-acetylglucosaminyl deacetylase